MTTWENQTLGNVRIEKRIARGGMAEVFLGTHLSLERRVAVKVLLSHLEEEDNLQVRFQREAKVLASLRHPYIVQIYDFALHEGQPYFVMEYVPGTNLGLYLRQVHEQGGRLTLGQIARILARISLALDYAHSQGVIHRDVKPANVLLTSPSQPPQPGQPLPDDVEAILTDFGLLRLSDAASQSSSGIIAGTPAYMSPEQARGADIDYRTDLYSLGVMLYEMLAGQVPFEADTSMGILMKHIQTPPPPISGLPFTLQQVLDRALEKDPAKRYSSAQELTLDFLQASGLDPALAFPGLGMPPTRPNQPALNGIPASAESDTLRPTPTPRSQVLSASAASSSDAPQTASTSLFRRQPVFLWSGAVIAIALIFGLFSRFAPIREPTAPTPSPATLTPVSPSQTPTSSHAMPQGTSPAPMTTTMTGEMQTFGLLRFYDAAGFLDETILSARNMPPPPAGTRYEAWLLGEETRRSLGILEVNSEGSGEITLLDEQGRNLLSRYNRVEITLESQADSSPNPSQQVAYSSGLPPLALIHLRHLFVAFNDTPSQTPLVIGLYTQSVLLDEQARALVNAYENGQTAQVQQQAEAMYNLLTGKQDTRYGDLNQDGSINNPGDGYGLLLNGENMGYIEGVASHTRYAMTGGDASLNILTHGEHVLQSAQNLETWAAELRDLCLQILAEPNGPQTNSQVRQAASLADRMFNGRDLDGNEKIEPIPGEGGVKTILEHAGYMIDMPLLSGAEQIPPAAPLNQTPVSLPSSYD